MRFKLSALPVFFALSLLVLTGCERGPSSLPADERPIPAQLPEAEREALRKLPFENAHNFRDLGGYKTSDGKTVKWGLIYRSDKLSELSSEDEFYLDRLGLTRIVDFRSIKEREAAPDRVAPASSIAIQHVPIKVTGADFDLIKSKIESGDLREDELSELLVQANRELVEQYTLIYRAWIQSILEDNGLPMAFHCTAGKDRTGFGAAIVLLALGVPKETVMADYLATNTYTAEQIEKTVSIVKWASLFQADAEALRPILGVEERFLNEAFLAIDEHYGSVDNYLTEGLGLTPDKRQQLRDLLLED